MIRDKMSNSPTGNWLASIDTTTTTKTRTEVMTKWTATTTQAGTSNNNNHNENSQGQRPMECINKGTQISHKEWFTKFVTATHEIQEDLPDEEEWETSETMKALLSEGSRNC
jgi:hypothetical protein